MKYTIDGIKADYKKHNPQGHWFDKDTMNYWGTKFESGVYTTPNDGHRAWFVTSEDELYQTKRLMSVRAYDLDSHEIYTISSMVEETAEQARARARFIAGAKL